MSIRTNLIALSLSASTVLGASSYALANDHHSKDRASVFAGFDVKDDSFFAYAGGVMAYNGDLDKDDILIKGTFGYGDYDYATGAFTTGKVNAESYTTGIAVGYQHFYQGGRVTGYIGAYSENHDLSPDDTSNSVNGRESGVKADLELEFDVAERLSADFMGSYTNVYHGYWTRFHLGYEATDKATIGPEVIFLGGAEYNQRRFGGALDLDFDFADLRFSAGWADTSGDTRGGDSVYGAVGISRRF